MNPQDFDNVLFCINLLMRSCCVLIGTGRAPSTPTHWWWWARSTRAKSSKPKRCRSARPGITRAASSNCTVTLATTSRATMISVQYLYSIPYVLYSISVVYYYIIRSSSYFSKLLCVSYFLKVLYSVYCVLCIH